MVTVTRWIKGSSQFLTNLNFLQNMDFSNISDNSSTDSNSTLIIAWKYRIFIGCLYFFTSLFLTVFYCLTLYVMVTEKSQFKFSHMKIIVSISVADITQLITNGIVSGMFSLTEWCPFWVNKSVGAFLNMGWFSFDINSHMLAFNRFVNILFISKAKSFFSTECTYVYIGLTWVYGLAWLVAGFVPNLSLIYDPFSFAWMHDSPALSQVAAVAEIYLDIFNLGGTAFWYLAVYGYLKYRVGIFLDIIYKQLQ